MNQKAIAYSRRRHALVLLLCLIRISSLAAGTYYVDCLNGNDGNDGRSPSSAWQTIQRVNRAAFGPGDSILLQRGCTWRGTGFKANGSGSVALPITLADYGDAQLSLPVIDGVGAHEPAVLLQNVQNWIVRNYQTTYHDHSWLKAN